jgi:hypothetical protein
VLLSSLALALCATAPSLDAEGRPILTGPELVDLSSDGRFKVHYTMSGDDAITRPEAVSWAEAGAGLMLDTFVGIDGWPTPPSDEGLGGDDRIDIYLRKLDVNGCTHVQTLPSGHQASYVEVSPATVSFGKLGYQSIAGHELHHVLEFALTDVLPNWIAEATATYAQYLLFHDETPIDIARNFLWLTRLQNSNLALDAVGNRFEYAGMIWIKFLIDHGGGDRRALLDLWRAMALAGDWVAGHDAALPVHFGLVDTDDAASTFAVWNLFACLKDDGHHYDPTTVSCDDDISVIPVGIAVSAPAPVTSAAIGPRGSAYVIFNPDCRTGDLAITVRPTGRMRFRVVERVGKGVSPVLAPADPPANVDTVFTVSQWNRYHQIAVVATSLDAAPSVTFDASATASGAYVPPVDAELPAPTEIDVTPNTLALDEGATAALAATAKFGTCADGRDVTALVAWRSSDEGVARFDASSPTVNAVGGGHTELFASLQGTDSSPVEIDVNGGSGCGCRVAGEEKRSPLPLFFLCLCIAISLRKRPNP